MVMSRKVSISIPEHVYRFALRKSKLTHGYNNFSGYVSELLRKEFTEDELKSELIELKKPLYAGRSMDATHVSSCLVCRNPIFPGGKISLADLVENQHWVHANCCRKE